MGNENMEFPDIEQLLFNELKNSDIHVRSPARGIGKIALLPIYTTINMTDETNRDLEISFFYESILPQSPKDKELGYISEDVEENYGVIITQRLEKKDKPLMVGEHIEYDDFVEEFVSDRFVRLILDRKLDDLKEASMCDEIFLEQLNSSWINREIGETHIGDYPTIN